MLYDLQLVITDFIWMEEAITGNEVKSAAAWIEVCIWLLKPVESMLYWQIQDQI